MKFFAIILSVFTIALSSIPCDDDVSLVVDSKTVIVENSHNDSHNLVDLCSPFCTCVCCASIVIEPIFDQQTLVTEKISSDLNSSYFFSLKSNYLDRIFQPPRA